MAFHAILSSQSGDTADWKHGASFPLRQHAKVSSTEPQQFGRNRSAGEPAGSHLRGLDDGMYLSPIHATIDQRAA